MRLRLAVLLLSAASPLFAQNRLRLEPGVTIEASLAEGDTGRYFVRVPPGGGGRFIYGEVMQLGVDVVITIYGPDGDRIAAFDEPARGPEPFMLRATAPGLYRVDVTPFEREAGDYTITLRGSEPIATTPERQVDQLLAPVSGPDRPGAVIAVTRGGRVIFARGYGLANPEDSTPNTPNTVFHLASLSKQFTSFAICLLADQGRLSLDDDVRRYLPELPDYGAVITLRHLLTHTSGVRDQWELWGMSGGRLDDVIRQQDLLRLIYRQRELNFAPGAQYSYSNAGFTLLAEVVARVSGRPFPDFLRDHVFAPLGMTSTQVYDRHERLVPGRAYSFATGEHGEVRKAVLSYANMGATSLFSSATDLARWLRNWRTGEVGGPRVLAMMQQRGVLNRGDTIPYGLGIAVDRFRGLPRLAHSGGDAGYRTFLEYFPTLDAGVIVLGNWSAINAGRIADQVTEAFFGAALDSVRPATAPPAAAAPATPPPRWAPDSAALAAYAGPWYSSELETVYTMLVQNGRLVARHRRHGDIPLTPLRPDTFQGGEWFFRLVRFERDAAGAVTRMRLSGDRARNLLFEPLPR